MAAIFPAVNRMSVAPAYVGASNFNLPRRLKIGACEGSNPLVQL